MRVSEMPHGGQKGSGYGKNLAMSALEDCSTVRYGRSGIDGANTAAAAASSRSNGRSLLQVALNPHHGDRGRFVRAYRQVATAVRRRGAVLSLLAT